MATTEDQTVPCTVSAPDERIGEARDDASEFLEVEFGCGPGSNPAGAMLPDAWSATGELPVTRWSCSRDIMRDEWLTMDDWLTRKNSPIERALETREQFAERTGLIYIGKLVNGLLVRNPARAE